MDKLIWKLARTTLHQGTKILDVQPSHARGIIFNAPLSTTTRPIRPPGSFALFVKDKKNEYPDDLKKFGGGFVKKAAQDWRILPDDEKKKYIDQASSDMASYKHAFQSLSEFEQDQIKEERKQKRIAKNKRRERKLKVSMGRPKHPRSPYNFYVKKCLQSKDVTFSKQGMQSTMSHVYLKWMNLPGDVKQEYVDMAVDDKKRYLTEMKEYVLKLRESNMEELVPVKYKKYWLEKDESWNDVMKKWPKK